MDELNKLDTSNVLPTSHAIEMKNVFREDEFKKSDEADDIINNAPEREGRFFKVKKVIG
jgi:aspartyl-tRNA(Asn)/glutamyl-tRNA(Gln) amidotransferase subunit C